MSGESTLRPGTYRLTRDVRNPEPDRRHKSDWSMWPIWEAGTEFLAIERSRELPVYDPDLTEEQRANLLSRDRYVVLRMVGPRFASLYDRGPGHEKQYQALIDALEPCPESVDALFERIGGNSEYFARWLVESGRLDVALFERLWAAFEDGHQGGRRLVEEPSDDEIGVSAE